MDIMRPMSCFALLQIHLELIGHVDAADDQNLFLELDLTDRF